MDNNKINELIAKHIMGLDGTMFGMRVLDMIRIPDYCTDIKLAFEVVEKIGDIKLSNTTKDCFDLDYIAGDYYASWGFNTSSHKSVAMAIALAALEVIKARGHR